MAATNRPRLCTRRILLPLSEADLARLDALAASRGLTRTVTVRTVLAEEHARQLLGLAPDGTRRQEDDPRC